MGIFESEERIEELEKRIATAKELVKKAISECESVEKLGTMDGAIWSQAFRTRHFEKILTALDPSLSRDNISNAESVLRKVLHE